VLYYLKANNTIYQREEQQLRDTQNIKTYCRENGIECVREVSSMNLTDKILMPFAHAQREELYDVPVKRT
jgi:hypothetical protein